MRLCHVSYKTDNISPVLQKFLHVICCITEVITYIQVGMSICRLDRSIDSCLYSNHSKTKSFYLIFTRPVKGEACLNWSTCICLNLLHFIMPHLTWICPLFYFGVWKFPLFLTLTFHSSCLSLLLSSFFGFYMYAVNWILENHYKINK